MSLLTRSSDFNHFSSYSDDRTLIYDGIYEAFSAIAKERRAQYEAWQTNEELDDATYAVRSEIDQLASVLSDCMEQGHICPADRSYLHASLACIPRLDESPISEEDLYGYSGRIIYWAEQLSLEEGGGKSFQPIIRHLIENHAFDPIEVDRESAHPPDLMHDRFFQARVDQLQIPETSVHLITSLLALNSWVEKWPTMRDSSEWITRFESLLIEFDAVYIRFLDKLIEVKWIALRFDQTEASAAEMGPFPWRHFSLANESLAPTLKQQALECLGGLGGKKRKPYA